MLGAFAREGLLNLVGGCCGTRPEHIAAIRAAVDGVPRRTIADAARSYMRLSGLEPLTITPETNFVVIGERTNVTGSAAFRRLIKDDKYDEAVAVARQQVEGGANILDVCMDEGMLDGVAAMRRFLNLIAAEPDIARIPVMVDSLEVLGDRGRPRVPAGQGRRQLDLAQGGRGRVHPPGEDRPPVRRRGRRDGVRRDRPGHDGRSPRSRSRTAPTRS